MNPSARTDRGIPRAPRDFVLESCFAGVHWHQKWELYRGVLTPGVVDVADFCKRLHLPDDLSGKRIIDIGGWQGCFSFECERRGASEVVTYSLENPNASGFNRMRSLLGSEVDYVQGTAYALSPEELGQFDIVLFLGVLYHLRYPLLAIDRIRSICRGEVYVDTHVIDDFFITREPGSGHENPKPMPDALQTIPVWQQYAAYELHPEDASNWFGPNNLAVIEGFESAGFDIKVLGAWGARSFFRAQVQDEVPERMRSGTYESRISHDADLVGVERAYHDPAFEPVNLPGIGDEPRDSRKSEGVLADLDVELEQARVPLGDEIRGRAVAKNTGSAVWLPDTAEVGAVRLAVQLYNGRGEHIQDLQRIPLRSGDRPVRPGETVEVEFEIGAQSKGQWQLDFDLISDPLFPFQFRTNMPRRFPVEVF